MDTFVKFGCVLLFCLNVGTVFATDKETVIVDAQDGTYVGYVYRFQAFGQNYASQRYFGIPYAEAPVDELRFKKPVRKSKLTQPYDASKHGPACIQLDLVLGGSRKPGVLESITTSEDCLFVNIFTPNDRKLDKQLPVMIYIHGGGFNVGTANIFPGDVLSAYGDAIVVTVGYRLSLWGFLSTGDENLPGNYGLWDQHVALQWVHDNIGAFGGDPDLVTLFGLSAGGASVVIQSMFPGNEGLIKRSIPHSGAITCPWAFNKNPLKTAKRLGKLVGCETKGSTKELADCLRSTPTKQMEKAVHLKKNKFVEFPMEFVTSVDGDFIPESPWQLYHGTSEKAKQYQKQISSRDMITGITSNEGLMMIIPFVAVDDTENFQADRHKFETELIPEIVRVVFGDNAPDIIKNMIINEYTDWSDPDNSFISRESFLKLSSDYVFNIQGMDTAMLHARNTNKNTYVYLYDAFPTWRLLPAPTWTNKPQHGDDMTTIFGYDTEDGYIQYLTPFSDVLPQPWELELTKAHMTMWTNFARTGNPNEPVDVTYYTKTPWPKYELTEQLYLNISSQMSENSVGKRLFARASNFWYNVLPAVIEHTRHAGMYSRQSESGTKEQCDSEGC